LAKEAGLFVPSGVFGNQLCVCTHTQRGQEILIPESNHLFFHETGAVAVISGVQTRTIPDDRGTINPKRLQQCIRDDDIHNPPTGLICMENAHSSGAVVPLDHMEEIWNIAQKHRIPVHLDGARIFNAAVAMGISASEISRFSDTTMFCLSKGLCAPIGSMIVGSEQFIQRARRNRKMMGGALRQVGVLAAAGLIGLKKMIDRLKEDHQNAFDLAHELNQLNGVHVQNGRLDINMVFCRINIPGFSPNAFVQYLFEHGIKINGPMLIGTETEYRFVTHNGIRSQDIDTVITVFRKYWNRYV
jgi:threonine aldolase